RPIRVLDIRIVLRALVGVFDDQCDRRAGGDGLSGRLVTENAGEDFHLVRFAPLRGEARLARTALIEKRLDVGEGERNTRRATIHHAAECDPVALAEGRDTEKMTERV